MITVLCCTTCNRQLQAGIYNESFYPNLAIMLSAFIVLTLIVAGLSVAFARRHKAIMLRNQVILTPAPMLTA